MTETIDITPSWTGMTNVIQLLLSDPNTASAGQDGLRRMATAADRFNLIAGDLAIIGAWGDNLNDIIDAVDRIRDTVRDWQAPR